MRTSQRLDDVNIQSTHGEPMNQLQFDGEDIPAELLPEPLGNKILVGMITVKEKTDGGIILAQESVKKEQYLRYIAKVLKVGKDAYFDPSFQGGIPVESRAPESWVKTGDIVSTYQNSGQVIRIDWNGRIHALKLFNDNEMLAIIPDPSILSQ